MLCYSNVKLYTYRNNVELLVKQKELYESQIYDFLNLKSKMLIKKKNPMDLAVDYIKNCL